MIVVGDTSPINSLAAIGALDLLRAFYGTVTIPEDAELTDPDFPVAGSKEVQSLDWIQVRAVTERTMIESLRGELDPGESESIALDLKAERVLIDERRGRQVAKRLNTRYAGILGVLVEAKAQGLIAGVKPSLDALIHKAGFWVAKPFYDSVLWFVDEEEGNE